MVSVDRCSFKLRPAVFGELALKNTQPRAATITFEAKKLWHLPQNPGHDFDIFKSCFFHVQTFVRLDDVCVGASMLSPCVPRCKTACRLMILEKQGPKEHHVPGSESTVKIKGREPKWFEESLDGSPYWGQVPGNLLTSSLDSGTNRTRGRAFGHRSGNTKHRRVFLKWSFRSWQEFTSSMTDYLELQMVNTGGRSCTMLFESFEKFREFAVLWVGK